MKRAFLTYSYPFALLLCLCILLATPGCTKKEAAEAWVPTSSIGEVEIATQVKDGITNYVVSYRNGDYVFGIFEDSLSISLREREGVSIKLNQTKDGISSTVLTRHTDDGEERIVDFNADGVADKKNIGNPPVLFLYFQGTFYPAIEEEQRRFILMNGERVEVVYDGNRWQLAKGAAL